MTVDDSQNMTIGTAPTASNSRLTITDPDGDCLKLVNTSTYSTASLYADAYYGLRIATSTSRVQFGSNSVFVQKDALHIGSAPVTSSAEQLNYTDVTPGVAVALKVLVVDTNRSIANINSLSAVQLTGTLLTGAQPNIQTLTSVNITTSLSLTGIKVRATADELNYLYNSSPGQASPMKAFVFNSAKSIDGINALTAITLSGTLLTAAQPNVTSIGTLSSLAVNGRVGIGTTTPVKALEILTGSPTIRISNGSASAEITIDSSNNLRLSSDNNITIAGNTRLEFIGEGSITELSSLSVSSLAGTLQTASQPNITSLGTLVSLRTTGDVAIGSFVSPSTAHRVVIQEQYGKCLELQRSGTLSCSFVLSAGGDLQLSPKRNLVVSTNTAVVMSGQITGVTDLVALTLTGTLLTNDQPNITSVGTLRSLRVADSITSNTLSASTLSGALVTVAQPNIKSIGALDSLTVSGDLTAGAVSASTLAGTLQNASQPNITAIGTLSNLNVTNRITAGSIVASSLDGTVITHAQPNITSVGNLSTLVVVNDLKAGSVTTGDIEGTLLTAVQPNISSVGSLTSLNVTTIISASSVSATTLSGTLITADQPNIRSIGSLTNLIVTNAISTASVAAMTLTGTLISSYQPNITTIGTLSKLATSSPVGIGVDTPSCALDIDTSRMSSPAAIRLTDGSAVSQVGISATGLLVTTSQSKVIIGSGASLQMTGGDIIGLERLAVSEITGTPLTPCQPSIDELGTPKYLDSDFLGVGT